MFSIGEEMEKTIIFFVIDIVMVFIFTYVWFKFTGVKNYVQRSLAFTVVMQIYFLVYYFIFDSLWSFYY